MSVASDVVKREGLVCCVGRSLVVVQFGWTYLHVMHETSEVPKAVMEEDTAHQLYLTPIWVADAVI